MWYHADQKKQQAPYVVDKGQDKIGDPLGHWISDLAGHLVVQRDTGVQKEGGQHDGGV